MTCGVNCVHLGLRLPRGVTAASGKKAAAILDAGRGEYRHSRNMGSHQKWMGNAAFCYSTFDGPYCRHVSPPSPYCFIKLWSVSFSPGRCGS